jgi:hypothetical protein
MKRIIWWSWSSNNFNLFLGLVPLPNGDMLQPSKTHLESETGPKLLGGPDKMCANTEIIFTCLDRSADAGAAATGVAEKSADPLACAAANASLVITAGSGAENTDNVMEGTGRTAVCVNRTADCIDGTGDSLARTAGETADSLDRTDEDIGSWLNQESQTVPLLKANGSVTTLPYCVEKLPQQQQQQLAAYRSLGSLPTCDANLNGSCQRALLLTEDSSSDIILV